MKKLPGLCQLKTYYLILITLLLIVFYFVDPVRAQEAIEIPGPELEDASFIPVGDLKLGDWVFVKNETGNLIPETITKLEYKQEEVEVYNLSVDGEETFFANDFAVHNKAGQDTTKPQCKVIVNPTTQNVNGLVKNRSFEQTGTPSWCPRHWYNDYEGGWYCSDGLEVRPGAACGWCGSQLVELFSPYFLARQEISGLGTFGSRAGGVLYKVSAFGKGRNARLYFREPAGVEYGTFAYLCPGCSINTWGQGSLLGWAKSSTEPIVIMGGTRFDHVSLRKLTGTTGVDGLDVNLYVAYWDNRNVAALRHWNQGEPAPDWNSEDDPRVIPFGPGVSSRADPISHTLNGYGARTINVEVRDLRFNVSDPCQATITSEAPTGTIRGNVYQNEFGECSDGQVLPDWSATCKHADWSDPVDAVKTSDTQFQCQDCPAGEPCTTDIPYGDYLIEVTAPADNQKAVCSDDWAGTGPFTTPVDLDSASEQAQDLYLWQGASAWFQTKEGDVHAQGGTISSPIYPEDTYFCAADLGDYPGLVSYNDSEPDFGRGSVSEKGWLADDGFSVIYRYTSLKGKVNPPEGDNFDGTLGYITDRPDQGVFYSPGSVEVSDNKWKTDFPSDRKVIIFIEGSLDIKKEVHVPVGSFLAFIVKEDIDISGQIGDKQLAVGDPHIQGVYITDGEIGTYAEPDPPGLGSGKRLVAAGIFVAGGGFSLERNLKDDCTGICNETTPAELFIARPDLFVNIPNELKESYFFEQEVAP